MAFRMVPDQIDLLPIGGNAVGERAEASQQGEGGTTHLRVDGAKLDRLARQVGELSVALHGLSGLADRVEVVDRGLGGDLRRAQAAVETVSDGLRAAVADVRLVSLSPILRRLPRLAREVSAALGKDVAFHISGDATQADKQVADALFEPLLHLVRNAIDHGIESAENRRAAGKPVQGQVSLAIRAEGERLRILLRDDGKGIDPAKVRAAAIAQGLLGEEAAAALSDGQVQRLIFAPGISTAQGVSQTSGRGVGMDAVQRAIERVQGSIDIDSKAGAGTTIHIDLPLNAITTRLLTVQAGGETYGLRLDQIVETVRIGSDVIYDVGQGRACVLRERVLPVMDLGERVGHGESRADGQYARLVVTLAGGEPVALRVDALGERIDAMVRERGGLLAAMPAVGGTAVLADGGVLIVLDLGEIVA
jgi:two-component system chemotaxis sensor kinase CheA